VVDANTIAIDKRDDSYARGRFAYRHGAVLNMAVCDKDSHGAHRGQDRGTSGLRGDLHSVLDLRQVVCSSTPAQ
jgi:hypothetical protein